MLSSSPAAGGGVEEPTEAPGEVGTNASVARVSGKTTESAEPPVDGYGRVLKNRYLETLGE
jgi:hypothetical protein